MEVTRFGVGWRRPLHDALIEARPEVLEVVPDHFFADPGALERLAELCPIVLHDVGSSVATAKRDPARIARLRDLVGRCRPLLFSDHLAMTRSPGGVDLGHLAPVWYTDEALSVVIDRVRELQDALGVPVALENIAAPFVMPGGDLEEGEFFGRLVEATGCGLLVDVTNALYDARNAPPVAAGFQPVGPTERARARLLRLPLHAARQAHLAGGRSDGDWWIDSHAAPIEEDTLQLLAWLRGKAPLQVVIVERDAHLPPAGDLLEEARRAREIWNG